jgi:hydrogenase maturation protease
VSDGILIVGYGNSLRTDDGLGWHAACRLASDPRFAGMTILQRHQLVPELAYEISVAAFVVFIDAATSIPPGQVAVERVQPLEPTSGGTMSHRFSPSELVALAQGLYGRSPEVCVVSCGAQSLELGDQLSSVVEAEALPKVIDVVAELLALHKSRPLGGPTQTGATA